MQSAKCKSKNATRRGLTLVEMVVVLLMLAGLGLFVSLEWGRFHLWIAALLVAAVSFATFGATIGAITREVSAASLRPSLLMLMLTGCAVSPGANVI